MQGRYMYYERVVESWSASRFFCFFICCILRVHLSKICRQLWFNLMAFLSSFFNTKMEESVVVLFIMVYITSGKCQLKMKLILCMHFILFLHLPMVAISNNTTPKLHLSLEKKKEEKKTHKLFQELNDWNILITSLLVLSLLWQEIKLPKKIFLKTHIRNKLCYGKVLRKMFHLNVNAIGFHSS